MTDRPINLPAPLVAEILLNSKTQTREPANSESHGTKAGDRLWVREHFFRSRATQKTFYKADGVLFVDAPTWAHPSEMVRADSRLTLIVTETRTISEG